jgi:hypothetical protein
MTAAVEHEARCACGQLGAICSGEATRISICHCLACQRRTGAPFSTNSRFPRERVRTEGEAVAFRRVADSGHAVTHHFCPRCGTTVYWDLDGFPDLIAVASGAFADPSYPPPTISVWERTMHPWAGGAVAGLRDRLA